MEANIRPSSDLRNHYNEIAKQCKETREAVIITVNGRGDTAVLGLQDYKQMRAELELLKTLTDAEEDVVKGRIGSMQDSFDDLRESLMKRNNEDV
ncbi:prevent-host-death family protein [Alkaliphilus metalliredigens QYMF]|uniref:Antitoxin n=1 Tax=Alkaliphilus metalliredigens (strain QYMF) TaxID=293826 RepID=A6TLA3_ALKMQ|nr:type II toxin-antitoxin system Phd/YefM family antitoxin [Alkaliphilus metalliredigens]ABR46971.1 prevent-host-death family protein [Alkaliphilus metalliredigens QYMF]